MKTLITGLILSSSVLAFSANAGKAVEHSLQASKHSALAVSEAAVSTAVVASAVVAVPIVVVGSSLAHAEHVVTGLSHHSHHHHALEITEITITVDPAPSTVMKKDAIDE